VLFESLPEDDLRQAVGVRVGGIKGVDSVVESVRATKISMRLSRRATKASRHARELDVLKTSLLVQHPFLPLGRSVAHAS
jgi:hypothetical protein